MINKCNTIEISLKEEKGIECSIGIGKGEKGDDGREIELSKSSTHIQYRYVGDVEWTDLIDIEGLRGNNGKEIELRRTLTHIQYRYVGDTSWNNLIALNDLKGDAFTYEDFTPEQLLSLKGGKGDKGDKGDTPDITHLENKINNKVSEVNALLLDVEEGEKNREDNEEVRKVQEVQREGSFNNIQSNVNKKIEEVNVAKNDMTNTVSNSLIEFERRFGELESANPIGEVTQSRITIDGTTKSSLSERLTYDFNAGSNDMFLINNLVDTQNTYRIPIESTGEFNWIAYK